MCAAAGLAVSCQLALAQPAEQQPPDPIDPPAPVQDPALSPFEGRLIREVALEGLTSVPEQLVRNVVRATPGTPLDVDTVRRDVRDITRLSRFSAVEARIRPLEDGSVILVYVLREADIIVDVQVAGNTQVTDEEIRSRVRLRDTVIDEFRIGQARNAIVELYREKGYYLADVDVDREVLEEQGVLLFRITEGERVRVKDIRFKGFAAYKPRDLIPRVESETAGIFTTGALDTQSLERDVASIIEFYKDRGHLDIRADYQLIFAPDGREVIVEFLIQEGEVYTMRNLIVTTPERGLDPENVPLNVYTPGQIAGLLPIKRGDVYSIGRIQEGILSVENAYREMGYQDVRISRADARVTGAPEVDLVLRISEGQRFLMDRPLTKGNELSQQKLILREAGLRPGKPLNLTRERRFGQLITKAEQDIIESGYFDPRSVSVTVLPESPDRPGYRDVLVEVEETNTGSVGFGAGVTSDAGVTGIFNLNQDNFDITDTPDSLGELLLGRAFRGGGQTFNLTLAPGTELQTYTVSLSDPYLFETDYTGSVLGQFREREFEDYDEQRLTARLSLGRRYGDRWLAQVFTRLENVNISNIDQFGTTDLFDVEGDNAISSVGVSLTRTSANSRFRPTRGARIALSAEYVAGDFNFTKLGAEHKVFLPIYEDFLGKTTVFSLSTQVNYIPEGPEETPLFERFYLGGRSFRGFDFRTISPKGTTAVNGLPSDDPVGGTWSFFLGAEIEHPIVGQDIAMVAFIDSGTVTDDPGFEDYRVSGGLGLRLYLSALSPAPFAFDFGFPIVSQEQDKERVFTFSFDIPF